MRKTSEKLLVERSARAAASRAGGITSIDYTMLMPNQNSLLYGGKGLVLSSDFLVISVSKPFSLPEIFSLFSFLQNFRSCLLKFISSMISERIGNLKFDNILLQLLDFEKKLQVV